MTTDRVPTTSRRGADAIVDTLIAHGVTTMFGVPGDTGVILYDALHGRQDEIEHVLARDERHAASMADGYARVTNRIGVVEVSSGGGTTFVVGGLGEPFAAGVPVLLITSDIHAASRGTGALTEIDQVALFTAVTKWRTMVQSADEIPAAISTAIREATTGRPGPVAVIVPENILEEHTSVPVTAAPATAPAVRAAAGEEKVAEAARLLTAAQRPAIVAGGGVHVSGAYAELSLLADTLGAPVATSIHGQGSIPTGDPWHVGIVGNNSGQPGANALVAAADVVLLVGTRGNATNTNSWTAPSRTGTTVIQIDIEQARAGRNFAGSLGLAGDCATVLGQLAAAVKPVASDRREARLAAATAARADGTPRPEGDEFAPGVLYPRAVVELVRDLLGEDVTVVADPGTPTPNVAAFWTQERAAKRTVIPRGHGPMGFAIPAAIGAAKATTGRPVVSVTADGSFAMSCGELETAARFRLPILFLQFTNNSMGWIKMLQHLYTEGRYFGVDPGPVDAPMVARANGIEGIRAESMDQLRQAVQSFSDDPRPYYIDIQVPHMIDFAPPVPAWDSGLAGNTERPVY
ncbi:thiamine pyrophosphate-binding protein [Actinoplanes couchii]|uniref:Acetolactate synthase n=1 Tax=Actinoplanes couchii TaxID=403638 RepID=A0ABQ3X8E7_9ACTN|nr:thiamine pyrophosphate-binding protein [Actinoplanes couchii]MDR6320213.1 acetolactate synthase-1/2/3 large subunit [Actinoplanes couchii]GID54772.1 acetolactate synthase [Actinoplanes couchii]